jgi:glycosyltransferase involved in cell wall biosynthesis
MAQPRLAIGLPVRNGERYLLEAVECLLTQTHADFELLIADNASTDATPDICRELVRRDARVSYVRHRENIGAAPNFNFVFRQTRGEYFKWVAHDDLCEPAFLARCIEQLDNDPAVALCHTHSNWIDSEGAVLGPANYDGGVTDARPSRRFIAALRLGYPVIVWGVFRRDAANGTGLIESFVGSDRYFLGELLLRGRAALVPECLFSLRQHESSFNRSYHRLSHQDRQLWFDPRMRMGGVTAMAAVTARVVGRLVFDPIPLRERAACAGYVGRRLGGFLKHRVVDAAGRAIGGLGHAAGPDGAPAHGEGGGKAAAQGARAAPPA